MLLTIFTFYILSKSIRSVQRSNIGYLFRPVFKSEEIREFLSVNDLYQYSPGAVNKPFGLR